MRMKKQERKGCKKEGYQRITALTISVSQGGAGRVAGTDEYQCTRLMASLLPYLCLTLHPLGYLQYIASGILTGHGQASAKSPLSMKSASQDVSALLGPAKSLAVRV